MTAALTTSEMLRRLERHYMPPQPMPGGVFVPEVGSNGGAHSSRCDAIYVGFTSASGRAMVGHELKVSRSDWLHELAQPGKADFWHDNTHEWWVVAPSIEIVKPNELPDGWGLMVVNGRTTTKLDKVVKATRRQVTPSWDAVRSVMARWDTLWRSEREHDIAQAVERRAEKIRKEVAERYEKRGSGDPHLDRAVEALRLLHQRDRAAQRYLGVPEASEIADALEDLLLTKRAAEDLRFRVTNAARSLKALTESVAFDSAALAKVLAESDELVSEG